MGRNQQKPTKKTKTKKLQKMLPKNQNNNNKKIPSQAKQTWKTPNPNNLGAPSVLWVNITRIWKCRGGIFSANIRYWKIKCWLVTSRKRWKRFDSQNLQKCFSDEYSRKCGVSGRKKCVTPLQLSFLNSNNKEKICFYFLSKFCTCRWQLSIPAP